MSKSRQRVFLITGVSSGFGLAFAEAALSAGHVVIGTVRSEAAKDAFEQLQPDRAHGVVLDVTDFAKIDTAVAGVTERTGPVDVLVNNAGYGHEGTLEESSLEELLHQFNVNVFGAVAMIKAVLPSMRVRRTGHIINMTSMAGLTTFPGISYYSGSKFALEGISESLAQEVRGFGIRVTAVAPGSFRTDWAGRSMVRTERSITDYDPVFDPVRQARQAKDGRQAGDPDKAAHVLLDLVEHPDPPVHLLLGSDALSVVRRKLSMMQTAIGAWEEVSRSTDFS
ncbi:oxidoreductase [Paraburkholderia terrae]|uniref:oxidoreductase n=1 Tax=Paraburkholderia TaxID=1822464 RepID=UPI001EE34322|nr:oxidoreductase [Paraburkholderia terrae]BEU23653.1 oxidoreductase [Paraburkholderia sp. 22B1P]GJH01356.1 SDR family NAD(P)-dependent oxidoreductase [Paraburkholderia terrae]